MGEKITFQGELNQALRMLEEADKHYKMIYDDSQLRMPLEDVDDVQNNLTKAHT